jgi:hypothetical protein
VTSAILTASPVTKATGHHHRSHNAGSRAPVPRTWKQVWSKAPSNGSKAGDSGRALSTPVSEARPARVSRREQAVGSLLPTKLFDTRQDAQSLATAVALWRVLRAKTRRTRPGRPCGDAGLN